MLSKVLSISHCLKLFNFILVIIHRGQFINAILLSKNICKRVTLQNCPLWTIDTKNTIEYFQTVWNTKHFRKQWIRILLFMLISYFSKVKVYHALVRSIIHSVLYLRETIHHLTSKERWWWCYCCLGKTSLTFLQDL